MARLAATCQRLRRVWIENVASIYSEVAPRSNPYHRHARSFLADQGGLAVGFPILSARNVIRMVQNSCVIEMAILYPLFPKRNHLHSWKYVFFRPRVRFV